MTEPLPRNTETPSTYNRDLTNGQRVKHRTGELGTIISQPEGDPIVRFDGNGHPKVCYQSEIEPLSSKLIYVASSWRNNFQMAIVEILRAAKFEVYDFKNPPNGTGFSFHETRLNQGRAADRPVAAENYLTALRHPRAVEGFQSDLDAMEWADTFVLVLPCGRSAHLELGWAVGAGKRTAILLEDPCTPELMYKMVDHLAPNVMDLLGWLGVKD